MSTFLGLTDMLVFMNLLRCLVQVQLPSSAASQLAHLQKKYEECLQMLEDSRMYMHRMSSPVTPNIALNYETPAQPTPSIMNELEDAIITDLQVHTWFILNLNLITELVYIVFKH